MHILDAANGLHALRTAGRILLDIDWASAPAKLSFRGCLLLKTNVVTGKYAANSKHLPPNVARGTEAL
jgi:hypothetical protein